MGQQRGGTLHELWQDLLAMVWPVQCVGCGAPDREVCAACMASLCSLRGRVRNVTTAWGPVHAVGSYEGLLRAVLIHYKHAGAIRFANELGVLLSVPMSAALEGGAAVDAGGATAVAPLIVTVPSRRARSRERGYRHLDLLVSAALRADRRSRAAVSARALLFVGALRARRGRSGQVGLSSEERMRNAALLAVPRRMRARLRGRCVVLVDDVMTTGATLLAAARALEEAGAHVLGAAVLCVTERRDAKLAESVEVKRS